MIHPPSMLAAVLRSFEADIAAEFNAGRIRAPVHLAGGNEAALIDIFADVGPHDWVCCSWRSHYHALLKGIAPAEVKAEIMAGRSISLCFHEHRFLSSAIVGGHLPIALGLAWSAKRNGFRSDRPQGRVWAFCGDMAAMGGMFADCLRYATGHGLAITFVIEDNGKSVCTDTRQTWGANALLGVARYYRYELPWPHAGAGVRVQF